MFPKQTLDISNKLGKHAKTTDYLFFVGHETSVFSTFPTGDQHSQLVFGNACIFSETFGFRINFCGKVVIHGEKPSFCEDILHVNIIFPKIDALLWMTVGNGVFSIIDN